ncbi:MAG: hypothetical protein D6731_09485 [Planctomycetota bacterium]|nr:MAG: hypothetical protein D6731_09485 [Planctomycetota bacterium]
MTPSRWFLSALLLCASCAAPPPRAAPSAGELPPTEGVFRELSADERERLCSLAELVMVGRVLERVEEPSGVGYRVEVLEVLSEAPELEGSATHPHREGQELRVTSFVYRPGRPMAEVRRLKVLERYLFWLSRMERPGSWLHLEDPAAHPLPAADATLEALRVRREELRERAARGGGR